MKNLSITVLFCLAVSFLSAQNADSSQHYLDLGMALKDSGLFAAAARDFDLAIARNPRNTKAYIENGQADLAMKRMGPALGNLSKAHELDPANEEVIKELSQLLFNNREFQKAIDMVQQCKDCPDGNRILGISYYNLEDYGKAQTFLEKAVATNGNDAESAYTLGRTYLELENEKGAIVQFSNAVALAPDRNTWMYELALIYYNQEDYKNALKYFLLAADRGYIKSSDYYENVGFAQLYTGDIGNGLKSVDEVLDKKPNNKELINNIAYALYETKHYENSLTYFTKLVELNPKDASSLFMAGMAFQKMGQKEKGQNICDRAIEMDPSLARNRQKKDFPAGL